MRQIKIHFPSRLAFGNGCVNEFIADFDSYLKKLLDAGFVGVYLDVVDAFEYFRYRS
jgi:hypothetical protein